MIKFSDDIKDKFAKAMIICKMNPLSAGEVVFPEDFNSASQAASVLHRDGYVLAKIDELEKAQLKKEGLTADEKYVESKLKDIIDGNHFADVKIKALEKLMDLKGLSKKPVAGTSVQVVMPRAIEVPAFSSDDEWEKAAAKQQQDLLNVSRSRH